MRKPFPFFVGQQRNETFGQQTVLSPYPVKTNMPNAQYCSILLCKNKTYIDLGGSSGLIFQGQAMYLILSLAFIIATCLFVFSGGFSAISEALNSKIWIDKNNYIDFVDYEELFDIFFNVSIPVILGGGHITYAIYHTMKDAKKTVPFRFHRQRREVAMFRWDEDKKVIQVRYFPWEEVCAFIAQNTTVTPYGMVANGTLMIAGNDEDRYGHFWVTMSYGTADKNDAVMQWEMIRSFMDDGIKDDSEIIDTPEKLTFQHLMEEYCQEKKITMDAFSFKRRLWWEINGTRFGIFLHNWYMDVARKHYKNDADFEAWSQPIPEAEWVKPSEELNYYNQQLMRNEYAKGRNVMGVGDIRKKYKKYGDAVSNDIMKMS